MTSSSGRRDIDTHLAALRARLTWTEIARRAGISIADLDALRGRPVRVAPARRAEAAARVLALEVPPSPVPVRHLAFGRRRRADIQDALTIGLGWAQIADDLGVSLVSLERWCQRHGHHNWAAACHRARPAAR